MAVQQISDAGVRRLEHLELLMVLCRRPTQDWDAERVAASSTLPLASAAEALTHLHGHQFLVQPDPARACYRLADRPEFAELAEIRAAYERDRIQVMNLFFACNLDNLRSFAEAFRLRRKPP